ncbi:MAG: cytochrome c3 family protein [Acidobacteria bacterium]|nr:cytochrome c3 family protein [Acidobacteriota bacterium]
MNILRFLSSALIALACLAQQREYKAKDERIPGDPIAQPVAYSHKKHAGELGLQCTMCHTIPSSNDGMLATFPKESTCMGCHTSIKKDSPEIRKLAAHAAKKEPVPWKRVYHLPDIIWFSHSVHAKEAKIGCTECHGDVSTREVLFQEKSIAMPACMSCHAARKAPNGCDTCHSTQ